MSMLSDFLAGLRRAGTVAALILAISLAAMVATACAPLPGTPAAIPAGPAPLANRTTTDEKALMAIELAYKAARLAAETAADTGKLTPGHAALIADADMRAFEALAAARAAYAGAQSPDWLGAVQRFLGALEKLNTAIRGD